MVDYSIVLIGFMGTGKSTVAKVLSKQLNLELIDTDKSIEKKTGLTISEIFEKYGEKGFRDIETDIIKDLKDKKEKIISCGGGVCLRDENIKNLKTNHRVILLEASARVILERIKDDDTRPILKDKTDIESVEMIMKRRKASYQKCADLIIDTDEKSVEKIVDEIIEKLNIK
ncbi:shikimate kinase [Tissierella creatinophila]|uniref:Shikimate kinase n=1 Tax=Tissierella creatinophila DSM 6911 TaxID=1123403 RepID=A0A1U7M4W3_TISCR|nr:shikimate kinase [Tissierella creatinophila]OLS02353.1 shikimate kinase [Tissierella creatinophila DSM 6911]